MHIKNLTLHFISLTLLLSFFLVSNTLAQDTKNCSTQTVVASDPNLPVAVTDSEFAEYKQITSLTCSQTMIDQGLAFLEKSHNSQLCFPLYQNLVTAAIKLNDYDKAFEIGRKALASYPEHMLVMTQLATIASHQALTGKGFKYFSEGENYGRQALSLLQAGKMPSGYLNNEWNPYKVTLLADLYQSLGIFSLMNTCAEDAAKFLASSTELNPTQPYNYFLLAKAEVQLYRNGVRTPVNSLTSTGKFNSLNEQIVATYAHACVMTEDEKYKPLRKAIDYDIDMLSKVFPNLKSYLAQSIEATKAETNASLTKPAQQ